MLSVEPTEALALADVVFIRDRSGETGRVLRCTRASCDELPTLDALSRAPGFFVAESASSLWWRESWEEVRPRAWRLAATGWSEVPIASVPVAPALLPPPPYSPSGRCLHGLTWGACDSRAPGFFRVVQAMSASKALLWASWGVPWLVDARRAAPMQAIPLSVVMSEFAPSFSGNGAVWTADFSAIDGGMASGSPELFVLFGLVTLAEGTGTLRLDRECVHALIDGEWVSLGEFASAGSPGVISATSRRDVWVATMTLDHWDGSAWQRVEGVRPRAVCAMNDGSAIVFDGFARDVRVGRPLPDGVPAIEMFACSHDDVWIAGGDGALSHRVDGAWVTDTSLRVERSFSFGRSDFGPTVRDAATRRAFVWDGARWQRRDEAYASFFDRSQTTRLGASEWRVHRGELQRRQRR